VAAWGIFGTIWDAINELIEGISNASEVRCAFLLGSDQPERARLSSYKSLMISTFVSFFITSILYMCGEDLPKWFTNDPVLQHLLKDLLPMFGIGNASMCVGSMSWTLLGAQGRYQLATLIVFLVSLFFTIPVAAFFSVHLKLSLEAQTSVVVLGYILSGTIHSYYLFRSDWVALSQTVMDDNCSRASDNSSTEISPYTSPVKSHDNNEELSKHFAEGAGDEDCSGNGSPFSFLEDAVPLQHPPTQDFSEASDYFSAQASVQSHTIDEEELSKHSAEGAGIEDCLSNGSTVSSQQKLPGQDYPETMDHGSTQGSTQCNPIIGYENDVTNCSSGSSEGGGKKDCLGREGLFSPQEEVMPSQQQLPSQDCSETRDTCSTQACAHTNHINIYGKNDGLATHSTEGTGHDSLNKEAQSALLVEDVSSQQQLHFCPVGIAGSSLVQRKIELPNPPSFEDPAIFNGPSVSNSAISHQVGIPNPPSGEGPQLFAWEVDSATERTEAEA
jgi:MatE